jgi:hypothetical protein
LLIVSALFLGTTISAQTSSSPAATNLCAVVTSPAEYNERVLSVEGILHPSEHALTLYSATCEPKEGFDVTTLAVLPSKWASLPNGKRLEKILRHGKNALVKVSGTFQIESSNYGIDEARFRFTITEIISVKPAK